MGESRTCQAAPQLDAVWVLTPAAAPFAVLTPLLVHPLVTDATEVLRVGATSPADQRPDPDCHGEDGNDTDPDHQ